MAPALALCLMFGSISQAISGGGERTLVGEQASAYRVGEHARYDARATVTRVVDGDTVDISPTVEGLSRVRLIGVDTPETYGGAQPYGSEASESTAKRCRWSSTFRRSTPTAGS